MMRAAVSVLVLLSASAAHAHALNIFVRVEGGAVKGNVYFTGGAPAQNVKISVLDAAGSEIGTTETDAEGNFTYDGPRPSGVCVFVASTPDGHRVETSISGTATDTTELQGAPAAAASMKSYEAELSDIHAAINRLENRLWLRDVLGGIGYIFGVAGLWALWKARSMRSGG